jgi:hypothetical protein
MWFSHEKKARRDDEPCKRSSFRSYWLFTRVAAPEFETQRGRMRYYLAAFEFIPNPTGQPLDDRSFAESALRQYAAQDFNALPWVLGASVALVLFIAWRMSGR